MLEFILIILLAYILDLVLGDPRYRLHPIRLMGGCIVLFTTLLRRLHLDGKGGGVVLVAMVESTFLTGYLTFTMVFHHINAFFGMGFDLFMAYSCLALKDLFNHTDRVVHALEAGNLTEARKGIALVVGRDVRSLDERGISRAAVETLAENFVDGFISPIFWYLTGGITGYILGFSPVKTAVSLMLVFKAASTLDSMVGYKEAGFMAFGWAGARWDDLMNFFPARFSLVVLFVGAWLCKFNPSEGMRVALRDRLKHDSPNAGHAESFVAGALEVRVGGPTTYSGGVKEKPWLGKEYLDPLPMDIQKAGTLLKCAAWVAVGFSTFFVILIWFGFGKR